jgi:hypothetical protein
MRIYMPICGEIEGEVIESVKDRGVRGLFCWVV